MSDHLPQAAVVVPAHNEGRRIARSLAGVLEAARERGWEVVVVDDGSTDDTGAVAERCGATVLRFPVSRGVAAARNHGAADTRAPILVFTDGDVEAPAQTYRLLVDRLLGDDTVHATGACPQVGDLAEPWSAHFVGLRSVWPFYRGPWNELRGFSSFQSECGAIRREVFNAVGGFPETYAGVGMEEFAVAHELERRGYVNVILRGALFRHHFKALLRRAQELDRRTARWLSLVWRRRRAESAHSPGSFADCASCALSVFAVATLPASVFTSGALVLPMACVALQVGLEMRFFAFARRAYGWRMALYAWPALQVLHAGAAVGLLRWLTRGVSGGLWARRDL